MLRSRGASLRTKGRCPSDDPSVSASRPPALLCDATYYGTLAAVRALGRMGVRVVVADSVRMAPAFRSRYTTHRLRCPPVSDPEQFVQWLVRFGDRGDRHVLIPTSDEVAYLFSLHRDLLSARFSLCQPDVDTMMGVLDKKRLLENARAVGLEVPDTWYPDGAREVERLTHEVPGPLMIKPRAQLFLRTHNKGTIVRPRAEGLQTEYERYLRENTYGPSLVASAPELARPMVQRYYPDAEESIYSLSGYRDPTGKHLLMLAARKVLQRPRRMGIGLCFEHASIDPELASGAARLFERMGYYGVFELEFIHASGRAMLIDMNPRLYNQLALDIARGMNLPALAYAASLGDDTELRRLVAAAGKDEQACAFCNRFGLLLLIGTQRLFGTMSAAEAVRWRRWREDRRGQLIDPVVDPDDPAPQIADFASQVYGQLRHPRAWLRTVALNR
jgi:D-aspartate ligase